MNNKNQSKIGKPGDLTSTIIYYFSKVFDNLDKIICTLHPSRALPLSPRIQYPQWNTSLSLSRYSSPQMPLPLILIPLNPATSALSHKNPHVNSPRVSWIGSTLTTQFARIINKNTEVLTARSSGATVSKTRRPRWRRLWQTTIASIKLPQIAIMVSTFRGARDPRLSQVYRGSWLRGKGHWLTDIRQMGQWRRFCGVARSTSGVLIRIRIALIQPRDVMPPFVFMRR